MATGVIERICIFPTEGQNVTAPAKGETLVPATLQDAGWFTVGSIQKGDSGDIDSESVVVSPFREGVSINPPGSQTRQGYIMRKSGVDEVTFTCYDVDSGVFALDSTVVEVGEGSGIYEQQGTQVYRSMLIEVGGLYLDWYPRVLLSITSDEAGYGPGDDAVAKLGFTAMVMDYESGNVLSGRHRYYLVEAGS
jgi:hypothetical protein